MPEDDETRDARAFAQRLQRAMNERGFGHRGGNELGRKAGISGGTVSRLLTVQRKRPNHKLVAKLARALDVNFDWLSTGEGEMNGKPVPVKAAPIYYERDLDADLAATLRLWRNRKTWSNAAIFLAEEAARDRQLSPDEWPLVLDEMESLLSKTLRPKLDGAFSNVTSIKKSRDT